MQYLYSLFLTAHRPTPYSDRVLMSIQPQSTSAVSPPRKVGNGWARFVRGTLCPIVTLACWEGLAVYGTDLTILGGLD